MTAEIAILNRQGVALAADSAVTIGRRRVWKTANKLFSLEPHNDIAIMIYNSGEFVGIPWETIVKCFREDRAQKPFPDLKACEEAFFRYLNSSKFSNGKWSDESIDSVIIAETELIKKEVGAYKTRRQMQIQLKAVLARRSEEISKAKVLKEVMEKDCFDKHFKGDVAVIAKETFKFKPITEYLELLNDYIYDFIKSKTVSSVMSGIVFAGFGKNEMLPHCSHYIIDGRFDYEKNKIRIAKTRYWLQKRWDFNRSPNAFPAPAVVIPFAQYDMFYLFMEGLIPLFTTYIDTILKKILDSKSESLVSSFVPLDNQDVEKHLQQKDNEGIISKFKEEFAKFRTDKLVKPVLSVVAALPKEEMAAMAEALVELTALRRKIGSNLETVSGPTDVAVISKGEGLIWIKRKHYFDPALNDDFRERKRIRSRAGGGDES